MSAPVVTSFYTGEDDPVGRLIAELAPALALDARDASVIAHLAQRAGESDAAALIAAAAALRATRERATCVALDEVFGSALAEALEGSRHQGAASRDRVEAVLAASSLFGMPGPANAPFVVDAGRVYTRRSHVDELTLAAALLARAHASSAEAISDELLDVLVTGNRTDRQRLAVELGAQRPLLVLSGGPGMGKTYTVRALLAALWLQRRNSGSDEPLRVVLAAPTGKAAARMLEAMSSDRQVYAARLAKASGDDAAAAFAAFLDTLTPQTIHRTLGWRARGVSQFRHDRTNPLDADVVIVDEASMVSSSLMARLLEALPPEGRLVLIGDRHQLASVDAGSVLADICGRASGEARRGTDAPLEASVIQLDKNRRFGAESAIGQFAAACIRPGATAAEMAAPLLESRADARWFESLGRVDDRTIDSFAARYLPYLERLQGDGTRDERVCAALALLDRFRVLAPHRRGINGVIDLNARIQERLSAMAGLRVSVTDPWWVGRPILITQNDYEARLVNGDVGLVVESPTSRDRRQAAFMRGDGTVEYLAVATLPAHETMFAMTVHKAQGSEYRSVALLLPDEPSPVVTRELVYTAVTRARGEFSGYGPATTLLAGLATITSRKSGLAERLWPPTQR